MADGRDAEAITAEGSDSSEDDSSTWSSSSFDSGSCDSSSSTEESDKDKGANEKSARKKVYKVKWQRLHDMRLVVVCTYSIFQWGLRASIFAGATSFFDKVGGSAAVLSIKAQTSIRRYF